MTDHTALPAIENDVRKLLSHSPSVEDVTRWIQSYAQAAIKAERERAGEVTLTKNQNGELVAVTRTDDEHRILKVLWERPESQSEIDALRARAERAEQKLEFNEKGYRLVQAQFEDAQNRAERAEQDQRRYQWLKKKGAVKKMWVPGMNNATFLDDGAEAAIDEAITNAAQEKP